MSRIALQPGFQQVVGERAHTAARMMNQHDLASVQ